MTHERETRGTSDIALVALDLDGTVIRPDLSVARRTVAAVALARRAGLRVVVATGRRRANALRYAAELGTGDLTVASDGALVVDAHGRVVSRRMIQADAVRQVMRDAESLDVGLAVQTERYVYWSRPRPRGVFLRQAARRGILRSANGIHHLLWDMFPPVRRWPDMHPDTDPVLKIVPVGPVEALAELRQRIEGLPIRCTVPPGAPYELVSEGTSKGEALGGALTGTPIGAGAVMAVGDGYNDAELFAYAGISVAMANARPGVRRLADFVTETSADDGASRALERVMRGEPPGAPAWTEHEDSGVGSEDG